MFEDNQSFIAVEEPGKPPAGKKHISIKCHHFRNLLDKGIIKINYIETKK